MTMMRFLKGPRRLVVAVLVAGSMLLAPAAVATTPASAGAATTAARHVSVETYNLDLGADLKPVFSASTLPDLVTAAASAYGEVVANNFPERANALAALIAKERPDVVGLQETALWQTSTTGPFGSFTTSYDYLAILLQALKAQKVPYVAAVENPNFVGQAPVTPDLSAWVRYTDRNVIIVRSGLPEQQLSTANPQQGVYTTRIPLTLPPPLPASAITVGGPRST